MSNHTNNKNNSSFVLSNKKAISIVYNRYLSSLSPTELLIEEIYIASNSEESINFKKLLSFNKGINYNETTKGFIIGTVCWGKIKFTPHWPCILIDFYNNKYNVLFFGDFKTYLVKEEFLCDYFSGYQLYKSSCKKNYFITAIYQSLFQYRKLIEHKKTYLNFSKNRLNIKELKVKIKLPQKLTIDNRNSSSNNNINNNVDNFIENNKTTLIKRKRGNPNFLNKKNNNINENRATNTNILINPLELNHNIDILSNYRVEINNNEANKNLNQLSLKEDNIYPQVKSKNIKIKSNRKNSLNLKYKHSKEENNLSFISKINKKIGIENKANFNNHTEYLNNNNITSLNNKNKNFKNKYSQELEKQSIKEKEVKDKRKKELLENEELQREKEKRQLEREREKERKKKKREALKKLMIERKKKEQERMTRLQQIEEERHQKALIQQKNEQLDFLLHKIEMNTNKLTDQLYIVKGNDLSRKPINFFKDEEDLLNSSFKAKKSRLTKTKKKNKYVRKKTTRRKKVNTYNIYNKRDSKKQKKKVANNKKYTNLVYSKNNNYIDNALHTIDLCGSSG